MTRSHGKDIAWGGDPADELVAQLSAEISAELEIAPPEETTAGPNDSRVGHLVDDDRGTNSHDDYGYLASDTHDLVDLSAEEQAMHVLTDEEMERAEELEE